MNKQKTKDSIRRSAENEIDLVMTLAYMEHQLDIMNSLVLSLAKRAELTKEEQVMVDALTKAEEHSSILLDKLNHPLESFKIPGMIEKKKQTRVVNARYLQALLKEGLFD